MPLTFRQGNDNLDLGWTTNGSCILTSLILDHREPADPGTGDAWELIYLPIALIVQPPDADIQQYGHICEDIPAGCYPIRPSCETSELKLPNTMNLGLSAPKIIHIRRRGFKVIPSEAATSYYHQGMTTDLPKKLILDWRIPSGPIPAAMPYTTLSRPRSLHQTHLLHPLWKAGDVEGRRKYLEQAHKTFVYDADTQQFQKELEKRAKATLEKTEYMSTLHYFTADNPDTCATCGAKIGLLE